MKDDQSSTVEFSEVRLDPLDMKPGPFPDTYEIAGTLWSGDLLRLFGRGFHTPANRLFSIMPDDNDSMTVCEYTPEEAIEWAEEQLAK